MYRKTCQNKELPELSLYFAGRLNPENRWIKMADLVPWEEMESEYARHFKSHGQGEVALNVRIALGALLIKEILGLSDREVVERVTENPYLQYFLGFKSFQTKAPFSVSLLTHFRKRLPREVVMSLNDKIIELVQKSNCPEEDPPPGEDGVPSETSSSREKENSGTVRMDAACAPADIKYPMDLSLVNEARELTETVIDKLHEQCNDRSPRPWTKRKICRKRYLEIIKHPKCCVSKHRGALRFLPNVIHRNQEVIVKLRDRCGNILQIISEQRIMNLKRQAPPMQSTNPANYNLPPVSLLDKPKDVKNEDDEYLKQASEILQATLDSFEINGRVTDTVVGPRITRFDIQLEPGVKVEKVTNIQNNIAMEMSAESIRIPAPVPGSNSVSIELPNKNSNKVFIRELFESEAWRESQADIPIILGKDVSGKVMIADLAKAPHLLIAGSTGSGRYECMNTLIMSLLFKFSPFDLKLILVDQKFIDLEMYRHLPHLITPVMNDPKKVLLALRWGVNEMEHRYQMLAKVKAKNLNAFNSRPPDPEPVYDENGDLIPPKLPLLVIIIDELADIMMTEDKSDVEASICRIAQKGHAVGLHLVIATQTPRKDIITGMIKANLPTKIAFKVSTVMDSRLILNALGAEKLLGRGDMLFRSLGEKIDRIQIPWVSASEILKITDFIFSQVEQHFDTKVMLEKPEEEER